MRIRVRAKLGAPRRDQFERQLKEVRAAGLRWSDDDEAWHGIVNADLSEDLVTWQHLQEAAYLGASVVVVARNEEMAK